MSTTLVEYYQILGSESRPVPTSTVSVVSNRTITLTLPSLSTSGPPAVTEAVIIQAQVFGYSCLLTTATTTSTLYLTPTILAIYGISAPITTQTFSQTTTTTWENYTETVGNTTCVYINSHYNATEPPGCPVPLRASEKRC
jgi:hypothetical protein